MSPEGSFLVPYRTYLRTLAGALFHIHSPLLRALLPRSSPALHLFLPGTPSLHLGSRSNLDPWPSSFFLSILFLPNQRPSGLPSYQKGPPFPLPVPPGQTDLSSPPRTPPANFFSRRLQTHFDLIARQNLPTPQAPRLSSFPNYNHPTLRYSVGNCALN
jgi:hypothetical protein